MRILSHNLNKNIIAVAHDTFMAAISLVLALWLRLGENTLIVAGDNLAEQTILFTVIMLAIFLYMRLYRGLWRYASMQDLIVITKAVTLALLIFYGALFLLTRLENIPRSVPFIHWLLLLALLGGPRFLYRIIKDRRLGLDFTFHGDSRVPVLLIGATDDAELFLKESSRGSPYRVVGIVDDDPGNSGRAMYGVRIYVGHEHLPKIIAKVERKKARPQKIILTGERWSGEDIRNLLETTDELGIPLARLPRLSHLQPSDRATGDALAVQPIAVEDLLGRAQAIQDKSAMQNFIRDKKIVITGAGGTIGSELARQIAAFSPQEIILYELSEFHLYEISSELERDFGDRISCWTIIGDVRDVAHLDKVFSAHHPDIVFHAAALKHVPMAEANPEETILTNIFGTQEVADACLRHKVGCMVLISTDKAVAPSSLMGASKQIAERYCRALGQQQQGKTSFVTVRFGNVLGSTGSVVPLFQRQIAAGGPVTVTHPDMQRFFMTVREAVELVIQAAAMGAGNNSGSGSNGSSGNVKSGNIYVLDMGRPVRILDLARQMIRLCGLEPDKDIEIKFSGLRPGEKLHEELFAQNEKSSTTAHASLLLAEAPAEEIKQLSSDLKQLRKACRMRHRQEALNIVKRLVPEFKQ